MQTAKHIRVRFRGREPLDIVRPPGSLYLLRQLLSNTYKAQENLLEIRIDNERAVTFLTDDKAYRGALTRFSISGVLYLYVRVLDAPMKTTELPMSPQQTLINLQETMEFVQDQFTAEAHTMDPAVRRVYEQALRGQEITTLKFAGTAIDTVFMRQVSDPLQLVTSLNSLDLSDCRLSSEEMLILGPVLKLQEKLEQLYLSNNDLGETGALVLLNTVSSLPALRLLALGDNRLCAEGVLAISRLLSQSPNLESLWLQHNQLTATGARHTASIFHSCPNLLLLNLGNNLLREEGARVIAASLPLLTRLTHLELDRNDFGPGGLAELCPAISSLTALELLDLSFNRPTEVGAMHIAGALGRLLELQTLVLEGECPRLAAVQATVCKGCYVRTV